MSDGIWARGNTNVVHYWRERTDHRWQTVCNIYTRTSRPMEIDGKRCKNCAHPKKPQPDYEDDLYQQIVDAGLPLPVQNYKPDFLAGMEYDLYWPAYVFNVTRPNLPAYDPLAVEVQGAIWRRGKHNTGYGLLRDYRKLLLSARAEVTLIMVPPEWIKSKEAVEHIRYLLKRGST